MVFGALGSIAGALIGARSSGDSQRDNYAANKEFAQHGIRWKVEDAKAAGLHPLAAIGMQGAQFSPIQSDTSWTQHLADAGTNIDRAVASKQTSSERLADRLLEAQIHGQELENEFRASQLARRDTPSQMPPPMPGAVQLNPSEITSWRDRDMSMEAAGPAPAVKEFMNADGTVTIWPSADAKQSIEDSMYEWEHMYRNRVSPWIDRNSRAFRRALDGVWWNSRNW